jgi:DNA polymerase-1
MVTDAKGLRAVRRALAGAELVALDTETTGLNPRKDRLRLLSLAVGGETFLVDCFAIGPAPLLPALAGKALVLHNASFDLAFLARLGFTPAGPVHDTMHLAQLLAAGTGKRCALAACMERELGQPLDKEQQRSDWAGELTPAQLAYAARDAEILAPLYEALAVKIDAAGLTEVAELERRCLPAVVWLAGNGVAFDRPAWEALAGAAEEDAVTTRAELDAAAPAKPGGGAWNWNSHAQVTAAFGLAGVELANTRDETLAAVDHPLAALLRRHRLASKRASTYGAAWLKHVAEDGRVYCDWRQTGALTGRMAAGNPNLQNLPRGAHRRCFVAPSGRVLVKADYSQIELRIAAKVADETAMIQAFRRGDDLHELTARLVTGKKKVSKQDRQLAKPINFGLIYGLGAKALRMKALTDYGVSLSLEDARRYRAAFFTAWPGIGAWHARINKHRWRALMDNTLPSETRTLAGRRVLVKRDLWHGARANYVVQGTGGDAIKLALALLWERQDQCPGAFPVLAVHDEIVVEADAEQAAAAAAWVEAAMVDAMALLIAPVPVVVQVTVAQTWGGD